MSTRRTIVIIVAALLLIGCAGLLFSSNLLRQNGVITFYPGKPLNKIVRELPFGYYAYDYYIIPSNHKDGIFGLAGGSIGGETDLFGNWIGYSNHYRRSGRFIIPPETHVRLSRKLFAVAMAKQPKNKQVLALSGHYFLLSKKKYTYEEFKAMVRSWTLTNNPLRRK